MFDREIEQIFQKNKAYLLEEICTKYDIDQNTLQLVGEYENYVYQYVKGNQEYILRLSHSSHRTEELIRAEVDWINYLAQAIKQIPQVHPSQKKKLLEKINLENSYFVATVFDKAKGRHPNLKEDWQGTLYFQWGQLLGKMHSLAKKYQSGEKTRRPHWHEIDLYENAAEVLSQNHEILLQKLTEINSTLLNLPTTVENYGLIHNDFHMWNFYVNDEGISPFDFDDCQYGWFSQDIAQILFHIVQYNPLNRFDPVFIREFLKIFFSGYKTENTLQSRDLDLIPLFLKRFELLAYIIIHEDEAFDNPWCINFLRNRKTRIEQNIPYLNLKNFAELY